MNDFRWEFYAERERIPLGGWSLGLGLTIVPGYRLEVGGSFWHWNFWAGWLAMMR